MGCCESTQKADDGKLPQGSGGVELEKKTVVLTVEDPAAEVRSLFTCMLADRPVCTQV